MLDIPAIYAAAQSQVRVVGDANGVIFVLIALNRDDRSEDLLLCDRHVGRHVDEDGGINEEAAVEACAARASGHRAAALLKPLRDVAQDAIELTRIEDRPDLGLAVPRISHPKASDDTGIGLDDLIQSGRRGQDARLRKTDLAGEWHRERRQRRHHGREVSVL